MYTDVKPNFKALMKHDHAHKGGGSGKRLTPFCGEITDYECAKIPLHDFRRVYSVHYSCTSQKNVIELR